MAIERYKEVQEIEAVNDPLLREAFRDAEASGVGYVIFPETTSSNSSSPTPLGEPVQFS